MDDQLTAENKILTAENKQLHEQIGRLKETLTVTSSRSGRKSSAEVGWDQIINTLIHDHDQRGKISSYFVLDLTTPADFLASRRKPEFAESIGMEGWEDQLTECVANALKEPVLPSPSNMKWKDVSKILDGKLPSTNILPTVEGETLSDWLKHDMKRYSKVLTNRSEMEATIRVLSVVMEVVMEAVEEHADIKIELQPSLSNHLIYLSSSEGSPLLIIEVKNMIMFGENDCTAQVLREAHITLQDEKCNRQKLPFILTNGAIWSVGIAVKDAHKIKVTECSLAAVLYKEELTDIAEIKTMCSLLTKIKALISIS